MKQIFTISILIREENVEMTSLNSFRLRFANSRLSIGSEKHKMLAEWAQQIFLLKSLCREVVLVNFCFHEFAGTDTHFNRLWMVRSRHSQRRATWLCDSFQVEDRFALQFHPARSHPKLEFVSSPAHSASPRYTNTCNLKLIHVDWKQLLWVISNAVNLLWWR